MKIKCLSVKAIVWAVALAIVLGLGGSAAGVSGMDAGVAAVDSETPTQATEPVQQEPPDEASAVSGNRSEAIQALHGVYERRLAGARDHGREAIVVFGRDAEVKEDESAEAVVVIGGSAKVYGKVREAVVAIGGDVFIDGDVGDAAVAILGNVELGTNASVGKEAVAVMGNVKINSKAVVRGDVVAVGGNLEVADDALIKGQVQEVGVGAFGMPDFRWLQDWIKQCVFKLRPLAPQVGWVWVVWGMFVMLYLLVAIAFPRPVQACVDELMNRPATTFAVGLLAKLLLPFVLFLLLATGIGVFVVPFVWIALALAAIVGKTALLEYIGKQLGRGTGLTVLQKPVLAFLVGVIILTLLYMVPVLGLLVLGLTGMWALGGAILAMFSGLRRETPARPAAPVGPVVQYTQQTPPAAQFTGGFAAQPGTAPVSAPFAPQHAPVQPEQGAQGVASAPVPAAPGVQPDVQPPQMVVPEAFQFPRAGFWERIGAAFLDVVLVGVVSGIAGAGALWLLIALAYFAGMWTWRGTTVGGLLLNLKVVRLDGKPVTFAVALVRAFGAAFSVIVLFLGFLWIAWDREKQAWHDKLVGTVVVRLPRSQPLLSV